MFEEPRRRFRRLHNIPTLLGGDDPNAPFPEMPEEFRRALNYERGNPGRTLPPNHHRIRRRLSVLREERSKTISAIQFISNELRKQRQNLARGQSQKRIHQRIKPLVNFWSMIGLFATALDQYNRWVGTPNTIASAKARIKFWENWLKKGNADLRKIDDEIEDLENQLDGR
jgi:chromosome segregation ATPase